MAQLSMINAPDKIRCLLAGRAASGEGTEGRGREGFSPRAGEVPWLAAVETVDQGGPREGWWPPLPVPPPAPSLPVLRPGPPLWMLASPPAPHPRPPWCPADPHTVSSTMLEQLAQGRGPKLVAVP